MTANTPGATKELLRQKEIENKEIEKRWDSLYSSLEKEVGKELADETLKEFRNLYALMDDRIVTWFAGLYDAETGGFYYSNSARDTACFRPDLESTYQTLQFMSGSGMCKGLSASETVPKEMSDDIVKFTKGLQDPNGYFYHPQWGKPAIDAKPARRGRDLTWGDRILARFGAKPTYDTPTGNKGDGLLADGTPAKDFSPSTVCDVGEAKANQTALPDHLSSKEKFEAYLNALDVHGDGYYVGNLLESQSNQIVARDEQLEKMGADYRLADIMESFFNSYQNPKTGLWTPYDTVDYLGINGLLKIINAYHRTNKVCPRAVEAFRSAMDIITSEIKPTTVCFVLNPWYAMISIMDNVEKCYPEAEKEAVKAEVAKLRREMLLRAPELIRATAKKIAIFKKNDGSFSYMPHMTGPNSQQLPVAIYGENEGDVNATYILSVATVAHIFTVLGCEFIPIFTRADRERMLSIMEEKRKEYKERKEK